MKLAELIVGEHGIIEDEKVTLEEFATEYLVQKKEFHPLIYLYPE